MGNCGIQQVRFDWYQESYQHEIIFSLLTANLITSSSDI